MTTPAEQSTKLIEERIHSIQDAFQVGKLEGETLGLQATFNFETTLNKEFISVAMEGCSMGIALISIKNEHSLANWQAFVQQKGTDFLSQIHVGLGWALAELQLPVEQYISGIDVKWQLRVLDGFGYYSGLFKRRDVIRKMLVPSQISNEMKAGFDQGLGRFLYYLSNGDCERLERSISLFPDERHADFWRGVGTAVTFIGCHNTGSIQLLFENSDPFKSEFILGCAMVSISIEKANATNQYSNTAKNAILKNQVDLIDHIIKVDAMTHNSIEAYLKELKL